MKYTKENIVEGINAKLDSMIRQDVDMEPICSVFKDVLPNYPTEIAQNVLEWVNDVPFTEIDYYGVSIKRIMESRELLDSYCMLVVRNLIRYQEGGFVNTTICYEML